MWNSEVIFGIFIRSSLLEGQSPTKNTQMNSVPDCLRLDGRIAAGKFGGSFYLFWPMLGNGSSQDLQVIV